jgi:hypothetical protein
VKRKTVSVEGWARSWQCSKAIESSGDRLIGSLSLRSEKVIFVDPGFSFRWPDQPEGSISRSFYALFLRCSQEWLTMCRVVVIIKQFREFSLACLYTVVLSDTQPAIAPGAEICLAEL